MAAGKTTAGSLGIRRTSMPPPAGVLWPEEPTPPWKQVESGNEAPSCRIGFVIDDIDLLLAQRMDPAIADAANLPATMPNSAEAAGESGKVRVHSSLLLSSVYGNGRLPVPPGLSNWWLSEKCCAAGLLTLSPWSLVFSKIT